MDPPAVSPARGLIVSAQRALRVMEIVAVAGDGVTAKVIARRASLNLSTTYQLINTLTHEGYLVRLGNSRGFGLGYKLSALQRHAESELRVLPSVSATLRAMHPVARAPLYFTIFRDASIAIADVADTPEYPRAPETDVGLNTSAHASACGKLMLAALPAATRDEYLCGTGMARVAGRTITRRDLLEDELELVARAGVALESDELQAGLTCIAVPVRDTTGRVRGAVAASGPTTDFKPRRWEAERIVRIAAARVSRLVSVADSGVAPLLPTS